MAQLEEGEAALAFGSGMAAVSAVLIGLTKAGDHILCSKGGVWMHVWSLRNA